MNTILKQLLMVTFLGWSICMASAQRLTPIGLAVTQMPRVALTNASGGGGGGVSYLVNETFESGTVPSGWFNSGCDFNYTASPLAGSVSFRNADSSANYAQFSYASEQTEIYFKSIVSFATLPASGSQVFMGSLDDGFNGGLYVFINNSGQLTVDLGNYGSALSAGVTYYFWYHVKVNVSGTVEVWWNTSDNFGGASHLQSNLDTTSSIGLRSFRFDLNSGFDYRVDNVQAANTSFF